MKAEKCPIENKEKKHDFARIDLLGDHRCRNVFESAKKDLCIRLFSNKHQPELT
jgi:hypothetical protein